MIDLRPLLISDRTSFYNWINDDEVIKHSLSLFKKTSSQEEIDNWVYELLNNQKDIALGVVLESSNQLIGYAGICDISTVNKSGEFYIFIGEKHLWGRGIGTEVTTKILNIGFGDYSLNRIMLTVLAPNVGGVKAYEKAGFKLEGRLRDAAFRDNNFHDKLIMSILKSEWDKNFKKNSIIMSVIEKLASSLGLKGNKANIALAKQIAATENHQSIRELVENLNNKNMRIQGDCIKTLYETAYIKPEMIADYHSDFRALLSSKNNRLVWGGMIALMTITDLKHQEIFNSLDDIMKIMNNGSVISIDNGVGILAKLNKYDEYFDITDPLLIEQLWKCPIKQLPMYMEKSLICISAKNTEIYQNIIIKRKPEADKAPQIKRLDKVLKKISKI